MLEILSSGILSLWLEAAGANPAANVNPTDTNAIEVLDPVNPLDTSSPESITTAQAWQARLADVMLLNATDAQAEATMEQYLGRLRARGLSTDRQGVWLQVGPVSLANHVGTTPLPAASITKVATSLAALQKWQPEHQFETVIGVTGPIDAGTLQGDLVIIGGGDPLFVWEEAITLGNTLNQMGISTVAGNLVITGNFSMNYESDWTKAGKALKQALNARQWPAEAQVQYKKQMPAGTPKPKVVIRGRVQPYSSSSQAQPIIRHQSLPLAEILKQMNTYSNNQMSEILAQNIGGAEAVMQLSSEAASFPREEIQLINGSGLGHENQISPRAATLMFMTLQRELENTRWNVADLFPVSGRDIGTLEFRKIPRNTPVKTGSLFDVSALAGVLPTRDRGLVWFAIINRGEGLDNLRGHQDRFLQELTDQWGKPASLPQAIQPSVDGKQPALGDTRRNQILQQG